MKFQFQLDGEHLNSSEWAFDNGYIEGDLDIYVNGQLYFTETNVNVVELAIQQKKEEIIDVQEREFDEHWSVQDCEECIVELNEQLQALERLLSRLEQGFVPPFEYEMYPSGGCQLFGCTQHGHLEYEAK